MGILIHGRASTYTNQRCRCEGCKRAWAAYFKERNRAHRAKRQALGICIECKRAATNGLRCALHARVNYHVARIHQLRRKISAVSERLE